METGPVENWEYYQYQIQEMKTARVFVSGFVQSVGFRHFIRSKAIKLGVKGYTRNLSDGRVEVFLQADKDKIDQMIKFCEQGPMLSEVKDVTVQEFKPEENFDSFDII